MDFFIQYFPLLKGVILASLALLIIWLFMKKKLMIALITMVSLGLFLLYKPVKLKINTDEVNQEHNLKIEQTKVIPPKVEDHSFEEGNRAIKHITKEELE